MILNRCVKINAPCHEVEMAIEDVQETIHLVSEKVSGIRNRKLADDLVNAFFQHSLKAKGICCKTN